MSFRKVFITLGDNNIKENCEVGARPCTLTLPKKMAKEDCPIDAYDLEALIPTYQYKKKHVISSK